MSLTLKEKLQKQMVLTDFMCGLSCATGEKSDLFMFVPSLSW